MTEHAESSPFEGKTGGKHGAHPARVSFDLEHKRHSTDLDESVDELDEFLELSTASDSPSNGTNVKTTAAIHGTSNENKSTLKRYAR